jgi:EAL domain-containing protein (putative c-di-GMP-specific phosphodiesterase class I)
MRREAVSAELATVVAFLQPIVSVRQREVRLVEALARGVEPSGAVRSPGELFRRAVSGAFQPELEEQCRRAAFTAYRTVMSGPRPPVLSINTDTSLVQEGARGAELLLAEVQAAGIAPSCVALEILESSVSDITQLEAFCHTARGHGFLIALDDVGTGHSNLERIPRLQPDILKIDRVLVHGMSESYHRREVFRALLALSHQIGAVAIAEGVETESDVLAALSLGCDLFQGFYFARPSAPQAGVPLCDATRLRSSGDDFRANATRRLNERRARRKRSEHAIRELVTRAKNTPAPEFDALLSQGLVRMPFVEALYILDERGVQITDTVHRVTASRQLFHPAPRGADQSLKPYYLMLHAGLDRYTSDPYISSASGSFCITMSRHFTNLLGQNYVLCCDLVVPKDGGFEE